MHLCHCVEHQHFDLCFDQLIRRNKNELFVESVGVVVTFPLKENVDYTLFIS